MDIFYKDVIRKVLDKIGDEFGREGNDNIILNELKNVRNLLINWFGIENLMNLVFWQEVTIIFTIMVEIYFMLKTMNQRVNLIHVRFQFI